MSLFPSFPFPILNVFFTLKVPQFLVRELKSRGQARPCVVCGVSSWLPVRREKRLLAGGERVLSQIPLLPQLPICRWS